MGLPIIVPCYFQNEETHRLLEMENSLGIEVKENLDEIYDKKEVYFFEIAYVFEHPNGKDTMIGSGVEDFRSPLSINKVLKLIG